MRWLLILLLAAPLISGRPSSQSATPAPTQQAPAAYAVTGMKAFLYYHQEGAFDTTDVMGNAPDDLWNVRSGATLVSVQVTSSRTARRSNISMHLSARVENRVLWQQTVPVYSFYGSDNRVIWIPFLVRGVGCGLTNVTATLRDSAGTRFGAMTKRIPFSCGE